MTTVGPPSGLATLRWPSTAPTRSARPARPLEDGADPVDRRPALAVVAHDDPQPRTVLGTGQRGPGGLGVLGHVGQQLRRAEVADGLDGRAGPGLDRHVHLGGHRAAGGQRGQGVLQAGVEGRRVDAPGQVPQVGDGLLGPPMGLVDQAADGRRDRRSRATSGSRLSSFSLAWPRRMARATSWAWVPSWRLRSMRCRVSVAASRVLVLDSSRLRTREVAASGPSSEVHQPPVEVDDQPHGPGGDEEQEHAGHEDPEMGGEPAGRAVRRRRPGPTGRSHGARRPRRTARRCRRGPRARR